MLGCFFALRNFSELGLSPILRNWHNLGQLYTRGRYNAQHFAGNFKIFAQNNRFKLGVFRLRPEDSHPYFARAAGATLEPLDGNHVVDYRRHAVAVFGMLGKAYEYVVASVDAGIVHAVAYRPHRNDIATSILHNLPVNYINMGCSFTTLFS